MRRHCPDNERGFVLIGVVWLLLLSTAIVALLMLRAHAQGQGAATEGAALQRRLDLDAATESVAADILIRGGASPWVRLPAAGNVQIGAISVAVDVASEDGRLDLNDADPAVIDRALQGLGYPPATRTAFAGVLKARRASGRITSDAETGRLLAPLEGAGRIGAACLTDLFTLESGRTTPDPSRMPGALATALGIALVPEPAMIRGGESLRIVAHSQAGSTLTTILRITGAGAHPISIAARRSGGPCG